MKSHLLWMLGVAVLAVPGCSGAEESPVDQSSCNASADCNAGEVCTEGACVPESSSDIPDASSSSDVPTADADPEDIAPPSDAMGPDDGATSGADTADGTKEDSVEETDTQSEDTASADVHSDADADADADQGNDEDTTPQSDASEITDSDDEEQDSTTADSSTDDTQETDIEEPECDAAEDCTDLAETACSVAACVNGACLLEDAPDGAECDDGDPCTANDACDGGACQGETLDCTDLDSDCTQGACELGACVAVPVNDGSECDDGSACTVADACQSGVCSGAALDCTALDSACIQGQCDSESGTCIAVHKDDGAACDDGDLCSEQDTCQAGLCVGTAVTCDEAEAGTCQQMACNPATGACDAMPADVGVGCDDGDPCTYGDVCTESGCAGQALDCSFLDKGCLAGVCNGGTCIEVGAPDGTSCDDGDLCSDGDSCQAGECMGTPKDCSDLEAPCTNATCAADTGECYAIPAQQLSACDDGDACTYNDFCFQGACAGTALDCSDLDGPCRQGVCDSGSCTAVDSPDDSPCDDGLVCTVGDHCEEGQCVGEGPDCSELDEGCLIGVCDDDNGGCKQAPAPTGTPCDDGLYCTEQDQCAEGSCGGTPISCPDEGPCVLGVCDEASQSCTTEAAVDDTPCDDDDPCTDQDTCIDAECIAQPRDCSDFGSPCELGVCDATTGECASEVLPNGQACDDGNKCTVGATCDAGLCIGQPLDCSGLEGQCNTAACDPDSGVCVKLAANENQGCNDGSSCTNQDYCQAGSCIGTPIDCSFMGSSCRIAECDPSTGGCVTEDIPNGTVCEDDYPCTAEGTCLNGFCQTMLLDCTHLDSACALGQCDESTGTCASVSKPNGAYCDDNDNCTPQDSCEDGQCVGAMIDCSFIDGPCTAGVCNAATGFCIAEVFEDNTPCDDEDGCTGPDVCLGGNCFAPFNIELETCDDPCSKPIPVDQNPNEEGVQLPFIYPGNTAGRASNFGADTCGDGSPYGSDAPDILFEFEVEEDGNYRYSLEDSSYYGDAALDGVISLHYIACPSQPGAQCEEVDALSGSSGGEEIVRNHGAGSKVYLIVDGETSDAEGIFILRIDRIPESEQDCGDGIDDDQDGYLDCADTDCDDSIACLPDIPQGALAIVELMANPGLPLSNPEGQWIEVVNTTEDTIALESIWLTYRQWEAGSTKPSSPSVITALTDAMPLWTGDMALLSRTPTGEANGNLLPWSVYAGFDIDTTQNVEIQLVNASWSGEGNPPASLVIDAISLTASTFSSVGQSIQLDLSAVESVDAATLNDDEGNWCLSPTNDFVQYAPGNYGTPRGGGDNGNLGVLGGLNQSCSP